MTGNEILLAHLDVKGTEHYDAVVLKNLRKESYVNAKATEGNLVNKGQANTKHSIKEPQQNTEDSRTPQKSKRVEARLPHVTPHKAANYETPPKKNLTRKRNCDMSSWKRNIKKFKRSAGESYIC